MFLRRFHLVRDVDVHQVSGTGVVAGGVEWPDGTVALRWYSDQASTVVWSSLADAVAVHGHDGLTRVVWLDDEAGRPLFTVPPASATTANPLTGRFWYETPSQPARGGA